MLYLPKAFLWIGGRQFLSISLLKKTYPKKCLEQEKLYWYKEHYAQQSLIISDRYLAYYSIWNNLRYLQSIYFFYTGCPGKIVFFHNSLQPFPRLHRCKRPSKLSTQCECTVTPIGWQFFVQPIAAESWRGRGGTLSRILGKKHNI